MILENQSLHLEIARLEAEVAGLRAEVERLKDAATRENDEVCQILGRCLGYPRYCDDQANFPGATDADGVCVGDNVGATLADEAVLRIERLTAENASLREAGRQAEAERDAITNLLIHEVQVRDDGNHSHSMFAAHCFPHATFSTREAAIAAVRKAAGLASREVD